MGKIFDQERKRRTLIKDRSHKRTSGCNPSQERLFVGERNQESNQ